MALIGFTEASALVLEQALPLESTNVRVDGVLGAYLATPLSAHLDNPPFDNSSVDGFAIRRSEAPGVLKVQDSIPAGRSRLAELRVGHAMRIFTGAPIPTGADAVVMQEECRWDENEVSVLTAVEQGAFIRRRGSDYRRGDVLLEEGTRLTPPCIGLIAANGLEFVEVYRRPSVSVISTGNELQATGSPLEGGQIYDSNGPALAAALLCLGCEDVRTRQSTDDRDELLNALEAALHDSDVLVIAGGMSVGDKDLVRPCLKELGVHELISRVSIRPGKPFYFGVLDNKLVFGLPGNPVSALVCFQLFCRPAILALMGACPESLNPVKARITESLKNKENRTEFVRGFLSGRTTTPLLGRESHMLNELARADCLIRIPPLTSIGSGQAVEVYRLGW